jgi:hypothetical protein
MRGRHCASLAMVRDRGMIGATASLAPADDDGLGGSRCRWCPAACPGSRQPRHDERRGMAMPGRHSSGHVTAGRQLITRPMLGMTGTRRSSTPRPGVGTVLQLRASSFHLRSTGGAGLDPDHPRARVRDRTDSGPCWPGFGKRVLTTRQSNRTDPGGGGDRVDRSPPR